MNWVKIIEDAIEYIEGNITEELTVGRIAQEVNTSAFYFQKGFSMLCGYTVGEYIRMRNIKNRMPAALADTDIDDLEAKLTDKGIRLLAGKIFDELVEV